MNRAVLDLDAGAADAFTDAQAAGRRAGGVYRSPLVGPAGNLEFFLLLRVPAA